MLDRIAAAARYHVTLIVAPAGYGKSVALTQYLQGLDDIEWIRYDAIHEDASLLGFARGFADALEHVAPDARKTLSGAYERSRSSRTPGAELATWLYAHLKSFDGVIAIDDLHHAESDPEIRRMIVALIERTRGRMRWIIASRSALDLPVASWLAYGDMDLIIDERDLQFDLEEARETAKQSCVAVRDDELQQILDMVGGWPTALSFALRTSTRSADLRNISATTREMVYRYLAEQVYRSLSDAQRALLRLVAFMPEIDIEVLRAAGVPNCSAALEALRDRVAFIYREREGVYRCHDLFAEYLRHEAHLLGDDVVAATQRRVAEALEAAGRIAQALVIYAQLRAEKDLVRLLHEHGLDLAEHAHLDAVDVAVAALSDEMRRTDAVVLGLRGLQEYNAGRFDRAQSLLERAISHSRDETLRADLAMRLGLVLFNTGKSPIALLEAFVGINLPQSLQAAITSILLAAYAFFGEREKALRALADAEAFSASIESQAVVAKVLHRMAFAAMHLELAPDIVVSLFSRAQSIASSVGLYVTAAAAYAGLEGAVLFYEDDLLKAGSLAQQGLVCAQKAGDRFSVQTSLLQLVNIELRAGTPERLKALERQFTSATTTDLERLFYILPARAMLAAWNGDFADAYRLLTSSRDCSHYWFDRAINSAILAVYALGADLREASLEHVTATLRSIAGESSAYIHGMRSAEIARSLCIIVEALVGRGTSAKKNLLRRRNVDGAVVAAFHECAAAAIRASKNPALVEDLLTAIGLVGCAGYHGFERLLRLVVERTMSTPAAADVVLTKTERDVLTALAEGESPKDIAAASGRSVYTVQSHIQNAIRKLGCSGRTEALNIARRKGLIKFQ